MIGALITLLHDEARRIWCYRWLVVGTTLVLFCATAAYVYQLPSTYRAWGQIYVNRQTPLSAAAEGVSLVGENYGSPYVVQKTMLNDEHLERIVRRMDPAAGAMSKAAMAAAVNRLRGKIHIAPDQGDSFVEIHYTDSDPVRARDVVRLLLDQFISGNVDRTQRDLGRAGQFLDDQIASYGAMLEESQTRLAEFRRLHPAVVAVSRASGADERGSYEQAVVSNAPATPNAPSAPAAPSAAAQRVAQLEAKLASLLDVYTEQYPDVITTRRQLAEAVAQRELEPSPAVDGAGKPAAPVAQRRSVPGRAVRAPIILPPDVAADWTSLLRNDELLRVNYQQLIAKRAATRMSQAVYGSDGSGKYQVTREPTVPIGPDGPNRALFMGLGAVMAIGGGVACGYLRAAMKGILVSTRELEQAFQLPVIGTVSLEPAWHTGKRSARAHDADPVHSRAGRKTHVNRAPS